MTTFCFFLEYVAGEKLHEILITKIQLLIDEIDNSESTNNLAFYGYRLINKYRRFLGERDGEKMWRIYMEYVDHRINYNHSNHSYYAMEFLLDDKLSNDLKEEILFRINQGLFVDDVKIESYLIDRFVKAIINAYPDIETEEVKRFFPEQYHQGLWSPVWKSNLQKNFDEISFIEKVQDFLNAGIIENTDFSELEVYLAKQGDVLYNVLQTHSNQFVSYKGSHRRIDHKFIYKDLINPLLLSRNIQIDFTQYDLSDGDARVVISSSSNYRSYTYNRSDRATIYYLLKAINLTLKDISRKERLFSLSKYGFRGSILLIEPRIYADLSIKHGYQPQIAGIYEFGGLFD